MSFGFFNEGLRWVWRKAMLNNYQGGTLSLGLYTNARGTLSRRNVLADIVPCAGAGYAPASLSAAGWNATIDEGIVEPDDVALLDRANHVFTSTGAWGIIRGAYVYDTANGIAVIWRDLPYDYEMVNGAKVLIDFLSEAGGS